jgi:hypothetical protein
VVLGPWRPSPSAGKTGGLRRSDAGPPPPIALHEKAEGHERNFNDEADRDGHNVLDERHRIRWWSLTG